MGTIQIDTVQGPILVDIAGDTPTEEEQKAIIEGIQELNAVQSDEEEKKEEVIETVEKPKVEVDYKTGVSDIGFRMFVAKGDNAQEKILRLNELGIPSEAISQDEKGEILLNRDQIPDEIKDKYKIQGSGLLSIEEEAKFTKADFAEFFSKERGPLVGGLAASLAASGFGIPIAALITGGGSTLGYLFDEYQEDKEGLRAQDSSDLIKGTAFEFAAGAIGESGGRLLTKMLGRLFKGSGAESSNDARTIAREILKEGGAPTVRAVNESAILGRLQAIYEGVFPNKKAAAQNAKFVSDSIAKAIKETGLKGASANSDEVFKLIQRDLNEIYGTSDDLINQANKDLADFVDKEFDKLRTMYNKGTMSEQEIIKSIQIAKRIFDEDSNAIYDKANKLLGGVEWINTKPLIDRFLKLVEDNPASGLQDSIVGKTILKGYVPAKEAVKDKNGKIIKKAVLAKYPKVTISFINSIKNALRNSEFDPSLVGTPEKKLIGEMIGAAEHSIRTSETELIEQQAKYGFNMDDLGEFEDFVDVSKQVRDGLNYLRKANKFYDDGIQRLRAPYTSNIMAKFYSGKFDPEELIEELVLNKPDRGGQLNKFLKSVRGTPFMSGKLLGGEGERIIQAPDFEKFLKDEYAMSREIFDSIPDGDALKTSIKNRFRSIQDLFQDMQKARGKGVPTKEVVRESLAKNYLNRMFAANKNAFGTLSASRVADELSKLGSTGRVLFGKDYNKVMNILQDITASGQKLTPREIASLKGRPIAEQVDFLNSLTQSSKQIQNQALMRSLSTAINQGNVEGISELLLRPGSRGLTLIRQAKQSLKPDTMEAVREAALYRILSELPDPTTGGKEFIDKVFDGSYSSQLARILDSYDDKVLKELFGDGAEALKKLSKKSELVSQKPIKGLGGLAAPSYATALGLTAFLAGPLNAIGLYVGLNFASKILRQPWFLKYLARPVGVRPGAGEYDKLGRLFEITYETLGQSGARETEVLGMLSDTAISQITGQPKENKEPVLPVQPVSRPSKIVQNIQQQASNLNVSPPSAASSAGGINPLLVPNPLTRATFGSP